MAEYGREGCKCPKAKVREMTMIPSIHAQRLLMFSKIYCYNKLKRIVEYQNLHRRRRSKHISMFEEVRSAKSGPESQI
jgi:hypothetical protein